MPNAGKSMGGGANSQHGAKGAGGSDPEAFDEFDLAADLKGRNSLHGENQLRNHNERQAQADARGDTDDLMESFEKLDKDVRAERDLGKKGADAADEKREKPDGQ